MDRISDEERLRIAELLAEGAPVWRLQQEINRSRYAIRRAVVALQRPARREPKRSLLRLSLAEREEISRGLAAGESLRLIAGGDADPAARFEPPVLPGKNRVTSPKRA
jgi:transposase, IS30 family